MVAEFEASTPARFNHGPRAVQYVPPTQPDSNARAGVRDLPYGNCCGTGLLCIQIEQCIAAIEARLPQWPSSVYRQIVCMEPDHVRLVNRAALLAQVGILYGTNESHATQTLCGREITCQSLLELFTRLRSLAGT